MLQVKRFDATYYEYEIISKRSEINLKEKK